MHLLVIGWSYRHPNTSKGLREQVETIFDQFRKIFFSEFLIENLVFFGGFLDFWFFQTTHCPKWATVAICCTQKFFFRKLQQISEILVVVVSFCDLSLFLYLYLKRSNFLFE
jgi:hypothetical protein